MSAHSCKYTELVSALRFITTFKLPCNANCIRKSTVMRSLPYFVANGVPPSLKTRMVQFHRSKRITTIVNSIGVTLPDLYLISPKGLAPSTQKARIPISHC